MREQSRCRPCVGTTAVISPSTSPARPRRNRRGLPPRRRRNAARTDGLVSDGKQQVRPRPGVALPCLEAMSWNDCCDIHGRPRRHGVGNVRRAPALRLNDEALARPAAYWMRWRAGLSRAGRTGGRRCPVAPGISRALCWHGLVLMQCGGAGSARRAVAPDAGVRWCRSDAFCADTGRQNAFSGLTALHAKEHSGVCRGSATAASGFHDAEHGPQDCQKRAVHTCRAHLASAQGASLMPFGPQDDWLLSLPLLHASGQGIMWRWLAGRAWYAISNRWSRCWQGVPCFAGADAAVAAAGESGGGDAESRFARRRGDSGWNFTDRSFSKQGDSLLARVWGFPAEFASRYAPKRPMVR